MKNVCDTSKIFSRSIKRFQDFQEYMGGEHKVFSNNAQIGDHSQKYLARLWNPLFNT